MQERELEVEQTRKEQKIERVVECQKKFKEWIIKKKKQDKERRLRKVLSNDDLMQRDNSLN